jgi:hypothetical protein
MVRFPLNLTLFTCRCPPPTSSGFFALLPDLGPEKPCPHIGFKRQDWVDAKTCAIALLCRCVGDVLYGLGCCRVSDLQQAVAL